MSLKAYDGMMSRKSIKYIQDGITSRLDRFKEASENHLAKKYAELFFEHVDGYMSVKEMISFDAINESILKNKIDEIKIDDDTTISSYIFQSAKILSEGHYINDFMVHLNISMQAINNRKILIYPNIIVKEHKDILLEFLEDWYCQDQCDADEDVKTHQWKQRSKDWYNFDEIRGFSMKIQLFDPTHYAKSLVKSFRGKELIDCILKHIPSDEKRIRKIAYRKLIEQKQSELKETDNKMSGTWNIMSELTKDGNTEIDDYINSHDIQITKIDEDFIKNATLK